MGVPVPCTWLHQVHGNRVVVVSEPGEHAGADADAAVTAVPGCSLAVRTADCAPVVLLSEAAVGIAHAGWRGLLGGVIEATVAELVRLGAPPETVRAHIGPCIRAGCYEFDDAARDEVAARYGTGVLATTLWGTPSLDLVAGVGAALGATGVRHIEVEGGCTACDTTWYSHRARAETARQASFVWLGP